jgi:prophage maintenance system killer protein
LSEEDTCAGVVVALGFALDKRHSLSNGNKPAPFYAFIIVLYVNALSLASR